MKMDNYFCMIWNPYLTMIENDADKGIIISSTEFTKSAINFVQNLEQHIVLLSLQDLIKFDGNFESVLK